MVIRSSQSIRTDFPWNACLKTPHFCLTKFSAFNHASNRNFASFEDKLRYFEVFGFLSFLNLSFSRSLIYIFQRAARYKDQGAPEQLPWAPWICLQWTLSLLARWPSKFRWSAKHCWLNSMLISADWTTAWFVRSCLYPSAMFNFKTFSSKQRFRVFKKHQQVQHTLNLLKKWKALTVRTTQISKSALPIFSNNKDLLQRKAITHSTLNMIHVVMQPKWVVKCSPTLLNQNVIYYGTARTPKILALILFSMAYRKTGP